MGDLYSRSSSSTGTGGIPIIGPINYPTGPKAKGKGNRRQAVSREDESPGCAIRGGLPPGFPPAAASAVYTGPVVATYEGTKNPAIPIDRGGV